MGGMLQLQHPAHYLFDSCVATHLLACRHGRNLNAQIKRSF